MKIMFLYMFPLWGNGSGAWLRALSKELVKRGHEVSIVAPERRRVAGVKHFIVQPPQMGVFVGNPELKNAKKYKEMTGLELGRIYQAYIDTALRATEEFHPEIIHAFHTAFLPPVARLVKILYGIRFIITTHGSDLHYLEGDRRLIGLIKDAIGVCRVVTSNSHFTTEWFYDIFGDDCKYKMTMIPGGVHVDQFRHCDVSIGKINKAYGLEGKKVVLFTGRLTKHKGVERLIRAAREIDGEVLILGDGPERKNLQALIDSYKLTNTRILGYMNPKEQNLFHAFYNRADVYVAPSTWNEPLGLVVLEAMAAKTPVIVSKKGGVVSLVKDGYNGYLVPPRNSTQIAKRVNQLLQDNKLRKKMGQNAYDSVIARFTWEKITDQFEKIYKKHAYTTEEYLKYVRNGK